MTAQQLRLDGTLQLQLETPVAFTVTIPDRVPVQRGEYACRHGEWAVALVKGKDGVYSPVCARKGCER